MKRWFNYFHIDYVWFLATSPSVIQYYTNRFKLNKTLGPRLFTQQFFFTERAQLHPRNKIMYNDIHNNVYIKI